MVAVLLAVGGIFRTSKSSCNGGLNVFGSISGIFSVILTFSTYA